MVSGAAVSVAGGRDREVLVECRGVGDKAAYPYYRVDTHILAFCGDARRVALEYPVWCVVTVPSSCGLRSQSHQMTHLPRRHVVRTVMWCSQPCISEQLSWDRDTRESHYVPTRLPP